MNISNSNTMFAQRLSTLVLVTLRDLEIILHTQLTPLQRQATLLLLEVAFARCLAACTPGTTA